MFRWYAYALVCYAYLSDYVDSEDDTREQLGSSRWFQRGWTLQELIAPTDVEFYDSTWTLFGSRLGLSTEISSITGIDRRILHRKEAYLSRVYSKRCNHKREEGLVIRNCIDCRVEHANSNRNYGPNCLFRERTIRQLLNKYGVSNRMSWAAERRTTRAEDIAYCLLGIFDTNMPLLYGEGGVRAFRRLQMEIARHSPDHSLLAWGGRFEGTFRSGRYPGLADSPTHFRDGHLFEPIQGGGSSITVSDKGFELSVNLARCVGYQTTGVNDAEFTRYGKQLWLAVLDCARGSDHFTMPALILDRTSESSNSFRRSRWAGRLWWHCLPLVSLGSGSYQDHIGERFLWVKSVARQN
ncbi:hypothetical protein QBC39DRAFT_31705 [Podospora conica]|nr:hypothetical protein QBC39DRAFT_31705 [Schizothecium conicum]